MYRYVTPTDVDTFIQFPDSIEVDARELVLTVEEDTLKNYEKQFLIMDWVIYCEAPRSAFFDASMDWRYRMVHHYDASGTYQGVLAEDAHDANPGAAYQLTKPIVSAASAKAHLTGVTTSTRFSHYKQCNRFFKYSFKVGDKLTVGGRAAQLYAVYLDKTTGAALPYWGTLNPAAGQAAENILMYYADGINLASLTDAAGSTVKYTDPVTSQVADVEVVCPPHPELLESKAGASVGDNVAVNKTGSDLNLRQVGVYDASGNFVAVPLTLSNFAPYTTDANRSLLLYWVLYPPASKLYLGESMYASWCDAAIPSEPTPTSWGPLCDLSGDKGAPDASGGEPKQVHKFVLSGDLSASVAAQLEAGLTNDRAAGAGRRMYMPPSRFVVKHMQPHEADVHADGQDDFSVPFAYQVANNTDFADARQSIMGGRVMQLVSHYMFDACSTKELGYFPFMLNEAKELTDLIVDKLAGIIRLQTEGMHASRSDLIHQILIKHGKRYFEEFAVVSEAGGASTGAMWDVLSRIDEMFVMFTTTVSTTVSNRSKDKVDVVRFIQVPVVVRVYDDASGNNVATPTPVPTATPTPTPTPVPRIVSGAAAAGDTSAFLNAPWFPFDEGGNVIMTTYAAPAYNLTENLGNANNLDEVRSVVSDAVDFPFYFLGTNYGSGATNNNKIEWSTNCLLQFGQMGSMANPIDMYPDQGPLDYGPAIILGFDDRKAGHVSVSKTFTTPDGLSYVVMNVEGANWYTDANTRASLTVDTKRIVLARDANYQYVEVRVGNLPANPGIFSISDGANFLTTLDSYTPAASSSFVLRSDLSGNDWTLFDGQHLNLTLPTGFPSLTPGIPQVSADLALAPEYNILTSNGINSMQLYDNGGVDYSGTTSITDASGTVHAGVWIGMYYPQGAVLKGYSWNQIIINSDIVDCAKSWVLLASNNESTWQVVDTGSNTDGNLSLVNNATFKYYRIVVKTAYPHYNWPYGIDPLGSSQVGFSLVKFITA